MEKFTISQSNDVILILENDVVNIKDTERLSVNDNILTSFTILNYNGVILNYIYHFILLLTVILANINWKFTKGYKIENKTFVIYYFGSTLFCFKNRVTTSLQSTNKLIVEIWCQENKIDMLHEPIEAPNTIPNNISSAWQSTEIIIVKESCIVSECKNSHSQKDTSLILYNNNFNDNSYESKLCDSYYTATCMDCNNITDNASYITNNEISKIVLNQLYVSGNEYQEDEYDCQIYIITQLELYLISSKFKNGSAAVISTDSNILNLYTVDFNQTTGAVILLVVATNRPILLNNVMIRNNIAYKNTVSFDISTSNLVVFKNMDIGLYNMEIQNNLKDDFRYMFGIS